MDDNFNDPAYFVQRADISPFAARERSEPAMA